MSGDLDINIDSILVDDDASKIKEDLPIERRQARYADTRLVSGSGCLTSEEEAILDDCMSPMRTGYRKAIESVLK